MQPFIELLKEVNIAQIFIIFTGGWIFYNRLDKKICRSEDRLSEQIKTVQSELKTLSDKVEDIDRRLCRIEGGLGAVQFFYTHAKNDKLGDGTDKKP